MVKLAIYFYLFLYSRCIIHVSGSIIIVADYFLPTDILLALSASAPELQNSISQLCEVWWARELPGKEGLVTHCLLYLVARTLADGAMVGGCFFVFTHP